MASCLFCCFLLQLLFGAVTGTEMFAFSGMSFPLFPNLTFHKYMTLYRNGNEESVMIARWEVKNATITSNALNPEYKGKIFMEIDKTPVIWICNVDQTHSAKYIVKYDINTTGPEVKLMIMENKQHDTCLNSLPNSTEKYFGKLTDEQVVQYIEKFLDDRPQYIKRHFGNLTEDEFQQWLDNHPGFMKKYFEKVTPEQMQPCNHSKEVLKESSDSCNLLFLGLLIVICITGMIILLCILLANRIQIREGLINMRDWIQKKLCCQHKFENESRPQDNVIDIEEPELSKEDQVHKWLNDHPDIMDKYLGKLTEDQICEQIQKWEDAYPGLVKYKYLDAHENDHQVATPTLNELSVTLTQQSGTGIEGNQNQSVSTQEMFNASQHSDAHENDHQVVTPTFNELSATWTQQLGTGIEGNQNQSVSTQEMFNASQHSDEDGNEPLQVQMMSTQKMFNASQSSDELVKHDTATKPTLIELAVTWHVPVTGTEDNQGHLELSSTYNSPSSATFSELGPSGIQPFNKDKQDANPEQDMAQDVRVEMEDSDSEDKCQVPFLTHHAKM